MSFVYIYRSCLAECASCVEYGMNEGFNDLGVFELVTRWDFDLFGLGMVLCFEYFTVFGFDTYDKHNMFWFSVNDKNACMLPQFYFRIDFGYISLLKLYEGKIACMKFNMSS